MTKNSKKLNKENNKNYKTIKIEKKRRSDAKLNWKWIKYWKEEESTHLKRCSRKNLTSRNKGMMILSYRLNSGQTMVKESCLSKELEGSSCLVRSILILNLTMKPMNINQLKNISTAARKLNTSQILKGKIIIKTGMVLKMI